MTPESAEKLPQSRVSWNYFIFNCVYVGESVHLIAVVLRGDTGGPETVVKMVVSCPVWVLGLDPLSSGRAANALTYWASSLVLRIFKLQVTTHDWGGEDTVQKRAWCSTV